MKISASIVIISVFATLLTNCTIQKRIYTNGYYVNWNHSSHNVKATVNSDIKEIEKTPFFPNKFSTKDSIPEVQEKTTFSKTEIELPSESTNLNTELKKTTPFSSKKSFKINSENIKPIVKHTSAEENKDDELTKKKNGAIFFTILAVLLLLAITYGVILAVAVADSFLVIFIFLLLILAAALGILLLFVAINQWSAYRKAKKTG